VDKRYRISVTEEVVEERVIPRKWERGADQSGAREDGYGYAPEIMTKDYVTRTIYERNTDSLNIVELIKAVEGMKD